MKDGKRHTESESKSLLLGDSWFGSVKVSAEISKNEQHCCFNVKTSTKHSPKKWIDDKMRDYRGGTWITLKGSYSGMLLYFIGYKYNKRKVLSFLFTSGAGSIAKSDDSYKARFPYLSEPLASYESSDFAI